MSKVYFDFLVMSVLILAWQIFCPGRAYAYIDPNTGGYVFQILFPIISAITAVLLFFKHQAVSLMKKVIKLLKKMMGGT